MVEPCIARREERQHQIPVSRPKKILSEREASFLLLTDGKQVLLERRPPTGIWGGLLTLPEGGVAEARALSRRHGCRLLEMQAMTPIKHTFSHFHLHIQTLLCTVEIDIRRVTEVGGLWLDCEEVETAAVPTPIRRLLRTIPRDGR